jgi:hypothetical protein
MVALWFVENSSLTKRDNIEVLPTLKVRMHMKGILRITEYNNLVNDLSFVCGILFIHF